MGRNISYPNQIAKLLVELSTKYPLVNIGKHLESIASQHGSLEWLTNEELYQHLQDYMEMLEEEPTAIAAIINDEETEKLLNDGQHLFDVPEPESDI